MKACRVCGETKDLDCFGKDKTKKDGHHSICKPCASIKSSEYYTKNSVRIRERITTYSHSYIPLSQRQLLSKFKYLCTKARQRKWLVTIDADYLETIYNLQQGLCRYSGMPLTIESNQPNTISLDRIDSTLGYIQNNVQLVCATVNRMKQEFSENEFLKFCALIANRINKDTLA